MQEAGEGIYGCVGKGLLVEAPYFVEESADAQQPAFVPGEGLVEVVAEVSIEKVDPNLVLDFDDLSLQLLARGPAMTVSSDSQPMESSFGLLAARNDTLFVESLSGSNRLVSGLC